MAAVAIATKSKDERPLVPFKRETLKINHEGNEKNSFVLYPPAGATVDELTNDPGRWAMMCDLLRTGETVVALDNGGQWWAEVLCVSSSITGARMHLLRSTKLPAPLSDAHGAPDGFRFVPDAELGFIVFRISDNVKFADARANGWTVDERGYENARRFVLDHATVRAR